MKKRHGGGRIRLWAVLFWLALWQAAGMAVAAIYPGGRILLATPVSALLRLAGLAGEAEFWRACAFSALRITLGFVLGAATAAAAAALSAGFLRVRELMAPPVAAIKSVPVVSFIILALIWLNPKSLSVFISSLMVFPTVYLNVLAGIDSVDVKMTELASVYRIGALKRLWGIWLPQVLPYLRSALSVAVGLSWKSGIAAEVIGLPGGSVGERLYMAKVYFETPDLFAWTVVVVALSVISEKVMLLILDLAVRKAGYK